MKYFHYLPIAFIALACGKPAAEPEAAAPDSTFQEVAQVQTTSYLSLEQYENELHALPIAEASSRAGLQLFADQFKKEDKAANDKALKIYLTYQSRLIEKLNEKFHAHPNFEQISSYIWGDSSAVNKDGALYVRDLKANGLTLGQAEGDIYIERDPALIAEFFNPYVTTETQRFFAQLGEETNQPFAADAGLIISLQELADRLAFWDEFATKNPDHIFVEHATDQKRTYLYFFMAGMDNTPAFDYEANKMSEEYLQMFDYFIEKYPKLSSAKVLTDYKAVLKASSFIKDETVEEFIGKHSIYMNN